LKKFYEPIYGSKGQFLFPAFEPGAEGDLSLTFPMDGSVPITVPIWYNNAIYGDPARTNNFSVADLEYSDEVDPVGISSWTNIVKGVSKYGRKGGKIITFHGTRDPAVPSRSSKLWHEMLDAKFSHPGMKEDLSDFYRLFMVPGMGHCVSGVGAWRIGQGILAGVATDGSVNQTDHSVLLSLVDWVEGGKAPEAIVGTDDAGKERKHCLWPQTKSIWDGTTYDCAPV